MSNCKECAYSNPSYEEGFITCLFKFAKNAKKPTIKEIDNVRKWPYCFKSEWLQSDCVGFDTKLNANNLCKHNSMHELIDILLD